MTRPARSIDRKLEALAKRIEAERKPMTRPPTDGLTSTASTEDKFIPNHRPKGTP